ncbi:hypothetical protein KAH81_03400 [bacterium]|nr:hypothetical protein [bacterium]
MALSSLAQRVDYIEYKVLSPFEEDGDYWGPYDYRWVYAILNELHVDSKPIAIARFLAFSEGDKLTTELIAESERRLRKTDFIGEAEIVVERRDSGYVAVVTATDLWTTKIAPSFSYEGRVLEWSFELEEVNLLGWGLHFRTRYDHDEDYDSWLMGLDLPRMLPGGASFGIFHSDETEDIGSRTTSFYLSKSRLRDADRLIYKAGMFTTSGVYSTWLDGNIEGPSFKIDDQAQYIGAKYLFHQNLGLGFGIKNAVVKREVCDTAVYPTAEYIDKEYEVVSIGLSYLNRDYVIDRDVDAFGRTEDIPIGFLLNAEGGLDSHFDANYVYVSAVFTGFIGENIYALNAYCKTVDETERIAASLRFSSKMMLSGRLCGRLGYSSIYNGCPEAKYRVGGQSVLRSYRSYAQVGERMTYGNLEWRIFTPFEFFSVRLGGALFIDAATAWDFSDGDFSFTNSPKPLYGDVGFELRLGSISSTTGQIARLGVARAFDGTWEFSLSSGQLFRTYVGLDHRIPVP